MVCFSKLELMVTDGYTFSFCIHGFIFTLMDNPPGPEAGDQPLIR